MSRLACLGWTKIEAPTTVAGRLKYYQTNWRLVTNDPWVINTISGYLIDLNSTPTQYRAPPPSHFNHDQQRLIEREIKELLDKGAISRVSESTRGAFYSTLFLVPKKDGGQRPVINLKALNEFVITEHFKMEGLHTLKDLVKPGDWMAKIDLKDAYFTIPIQVAHRKLLRFHFDGKAFQFNCLPFGLTSAPWVFTKTLKPVMALLRELGVRLIIYIDDILILGESTQQVEDHAAALVFLLEHLGFIINSKKSLLSPTQVMEFLGVLVNTLEMELKLPGEKLRKIRQEASKLKEEGLMITARELSRLLGKMNATAPVIHPAPLFCRHLQRCLAQSLARHYQNYEGKLYLDQESREELQWWSQETSRWNGRAIIRKEVDLIIESDASLMGWGATTGSLRTGGPWSREEKLMHINCLELLAAMLALQTFTKERRNITVLLCLDNTTAVSYINNLGGTVSKELLRLARALWMWCLKRNIHLTAQHLPGRENIVADQESRLMIDKSDWKLSERIFQKINYQFGPLEVDLFASRLSAQLPTFFSWRPDPLAQATDAFLQEWGKSKGFANPPWCLIGRTLAQIRNQRVHEVILITPLWKTQPWYPTVLGMVIDHPRLIKDTPVASTPIDYLPQLVVWRVSGNVTRARDYLKRLHRSCSTHGDQRRTNLTTHSLGSGVAGVLNGIEIPLKVL